MVHGNLRLTLDNAVTALVSERRTCLAIRGGVAVSIHYSANIPHRYSADIPRRAGQAVTLFLVDNNPHVKKDQRPAFWIFGLAVVGIISVNI